MRHVLWGPPGVAKSGAVLFAILVTTGCTYSENTELFPKKPHYLIPSLGNEYAGPGAGPEVTRENTQISAGEVTGLAPEQPVAFPHDRHVQNGITCEYCHNAARNSIHAGVPDGQTCMGCHKFVLKDSPEIKIVKDHFDAGQPMPWEKVHDLPDFVTFSHMRHVRAGVQCTECHGQVQTMHGTRVTKTDAEGVTTEKVENTMVREAPLQMGWCLDCHATHPSVDKNYGDNASIRRAELKDCWTCHK